MMKIGVAAPCHTRDEKYVKQFIECLDKLNPQPYARCIYINDGSEGLGAARTFGFDYLYEEMNCDIVLNTSVDHYLFPDILHSVAKDQITGYGFLTLKPSTFITVIKRLFSPHAWTGVYTVPKKIWYAFKESPHYHKWDGEGDSLQWFALENNLAIKRIKPPKYWILRYSLTMKEHAASLGGKRAVLKLMDAWD